MPLYRMQCSYAADSTLARDYMVNTLWFNDQGVGTDPANLCNDLAVIWNTLFGTPAREINVRAYLHNPGTPQDGPPVAVKTLNPGAAPTTGVMREIALCLSFYAGQNRARRRGRIYVPPFIFGTTFPVRPLPALRTTVLNLADSFSSLGGVDVDWVVHSRAEDASFKVTNAWVDDEWDVQRRRGLRSTTRTEKAVSG